MRIIAKPALDDFWKQHDVRKAHWSTPQDLKNQYRNVSIIENNRAVFNIKGNRYRLVVAIDYKRQLVFIKFIGTHTEYDKIDASTIEKY